MSTSRRVAVLLSLVAGALAATGAFVLGQGHVSAYVVRTGSMSPTLRPGDLVLDRPATTLRRGEIATFHISSTDVVTHRVAATTGHGIRTKGDANRTQDPWRVRPADVVGKVASVVPKAGFAFVYLRQPAGAASLVTSMLALLFAWQMFFGGSRPSAVKGGAAVLAAVALLGVVVTAGSRTATTTGATFSDSRSGTFAGTVSP